MVAVKPRLSITGRGWRPASASRVKLDMLRDPMRMRSAHPATSSTSRGSTTSATKGIPKRSRASTSSSRPARPSPWKE